MALQQHLTSHTLSRNSDTSGEASARPLLSLSGWRCGSDIRPAYHCSLLLEVRWSATGADSDSKLKQSPLPPPPVSFAFRFMRFEHVLNGRSFGFTVMTVNSMVS